MSTYSPFLRLASSGDIKALRGGEQKIETDKHRRTSSQHARLASDVILGDAAGANSGEHRNEW